MNCSEVKTGLMPYLDGELLDAEAAAVDQHVAQCADCAQLVAHERAQWQALRQKLKEATPAMPEAARLRLLGALHNERRDERRRRVAALSAAAAGVALTAFVGHAQYKNHQRTLYLEDAVARHARQYPLEIQKPTPEQLEAWFGGKLDHRVAVPQFPSIRTAGARLLNVRDRPAAYIRYERASADQRPGQLGLFVYGDKPGDVEVGALQQPDVEASQGYNVVTWRDGDVVYQLVSDLDEGDVMKLLPAQAVPNPVVDDLIKHQPVQATPASLQR